MFVFGQNYVGGAKSYSLRPTTQDENTYDYLTLHNGVYDNLFITKNTKYEMTGQFPKTWDWDTIFWAPFNGTTNAGNVDWNLDTVSHLLIKRKEKDEYKWKTLYVQEVNKLDDFNINGYDYTNASETDYVYALVPILNGMEDAYSRAEVESRFNGVFIAEKDRIFGTEITDGSCDYTRNFPNTTTPTIHNKYPTDVNTSVACYDTGTVSGTFMELDENCELNFDDDRGRVKYQKWIIDQLSNRKPKLLKNLDGYIRLVKIEDQIQDAMETIYNNRKLTFTWTEIGDPNSEKDMYYSGLSDVGEEWWSMMEE